MEKDHATMSVANYFALLVEASEKTQRQIAIELGYDNPNIITMFKQGHTRIPLNKVGPIANALGIDAMLFLKKVMAEYMPSTFDALEGILQGLALSKEELDLIKNHRTLMMRYEIRRAKERY